MFIVGFAVDAEKDDPRLIVKGSEIGAFGKDCELAETAVKTHQAQAKLRNFFMVPTDTCPQTLQRD